MGQLLSEPIVDKTSEKGCDEHWLIYGTSSMQGWRISMEDAHTAVLDLKREDGKQSPDKKISFFAVYDGHGGSKAAIFAGQHLHNIVARQAAFEKGDYEQALKDGFLSTDRAILQDVSFGNDPSGCTATTALVTDSKIFVANAGDSRTVLGVKGHAKPLSYDHKPQNEGEKARIVAAGGFVDGGRVNGNLALSRAIGDFDFKKSPELPPEEQVVTAFPDVMEHDISPDDEFIVLACDGIWDCLTSQQVVEFVRRGIAEKQDLQLICENLMDNCLASSSDGAGIGCDNMTVTIVGLLNGMTSEEWYDLVATRVANGEGAVGHPELAVLKGPPTVERTSRSISLDPLGLLDRIESGGNELVVLDNGQYLIRKISDEGEGEGEGEEGEEVEVDGEGRIVVVPDEEEEEEEEEETESEAQTSEPAKEDEKVAAPESASAAEEASA